jgi:hypothetical protein
MKKRNRTLIICGLIWLVIALGVTIAGFALSGADIIAWFSSKWAMYVYTFLGVYILILIFVFLIPWIFKRM